MKIEKIGKTPFFRLCKRDHKYVVKRDTGYLFRCQSGVTIVNLVIARRGRGEWDITEDTSGLGFPWTFPTLKAAAESITPDKIDRVIFLLHYAQKEIDIINAARRGDIETEEA